MIGPNEPSLSTSRVGGTLNRRVFLSATGASAAAMATARWPALAVAADPPPSRKPEELVKQLYDSLSPEQRKQICFDWDHVDPKRGLLRTRISANWHVTDKRIRSDFYTSEQQRLIRGIFEGLLQPDWIARIDRQLKDDAEGFGPSQSIAIFGAPGSGKFQLALTGRHITVRCDGGTEHLAFGGPIFYGHAASGFREKPGHPGNVFWHQAVAASDVFKMLDEKQRGRALLDKAPRQSDVAFRGTQGPLPGIPIGQLSDQQRQRAERVLQLLVEPYRQADRERVMQCLKAQGGLEKCHLAFYKEGYLGHEGVWDIWRLEGPAFVWHFHGVPHVHTWVHIADDPSVKLNV